MLLRKPAITLIIFSLFALVISRCAVKPLKYVVTSIRKKSRRTVASVMKDVGKEARNRLRAAFAVKGASYPPEKAHFVVLKASATLMLYAEDAELNITHITNYPLTATSGVLGPKLREGDRQIPEGIYRVIGFNPNSSYHLSLKINYPNEYDLARANEEGRENPGSDIFIHGKAVSIGCVAVGDVAIEELFTLAFDVGKENVSVVIAPYDMRKEGMMQTNARSRPWVIDLYRNIEERLLRFPRTRE